METTLVTLYRKGTRLMSVDDKVRLLELAPIMVG
jgi:hypothetical protein